MSEMIEVTLKIPAPPEGWVYDCVRRATAKSELYYYDGRWIKWTFSDETDGIYPIAVPKQQWRPATEADVGRTDARFSDCGCKWSNGKLIYFINGGVPFPYVTILDTMPSDAVSFSRCEVPIT